MLRRNVLFANNKVSTVGCRDDSSQPLKFRTPQGSNTKPTAREKAINCLIDCPL
jgi:hypothetical protein